LPAPAAVVDVGRGVDAARAAGRVAFVTDDAAVLRAYGLPVLGSGALKAAAVAILGVAAERDALAAAQALTRATPAGAGSGAYADIRGVADVARRALTACALSTAQVRGQPALARNREQRADREHDAKQRCAGGVHSR